MIPIAAKTPVVAAAVGGYFTLRPVILTPTHTGPHAACNLSMATAVVIVPSSPIIPVSRVYWVAARG